MAPFGADDSELESTNAYATGQAALLLFDAREALSWADLVYAIDLNGMNSSVSPLSQPVQANRPFKWLNWDAARVLGMLRGSYLFELDEKRIIQDPESLRASSIRQGSAWQAWAQLRDVVSDSDEFLRPQSGGARRRLAHRFMGTRHPAIGAVLRQGQRAQSRPARLYFLERQLGSLPAWPTRSRHSPSRSPTWIRPLRSACCAFTNTFFHASSRPPMSRRASPAAFMSPRAVRSPPSALMQEIQGLINPVPPEGNALIQNVEDLQTQTRLKVTRARAVVEDTVDLLAEDLLDRHLLAGHAQVAELRTRSFGAAPTAVWTAFRAMLPFNGIGPESPPHPIHEIAAHFHPRATLRQVSTRTTRASREAHGRRSE